MLSSQKMRRGPAAPFLALFLVILISLIVFFIVREKRKAEEAQLSELTEAAQAFYEQIAVARLWNAGHGGVYVEVTPATQPNPYLDVPDRDLVAADGRRFTKINPAYMTRQLSELADSRHGNKFRIAGFRPLNPANALEPWEADALLRIGHDGTDKAVTLFRVENGKRFFKYLMPLRIERPCLVCHGKQGYRPGELKGGIVISIPLERHDAIHAERSKHTLISLSMVGLVSILFTAFITRRLSRRLSEEIRKNIEQEKLAAVMALGGAAAHEMRQPMTVVTCMLDIMRIKAERGEPVDVSDMKVIKGQCERMDDIIERLLNIMDYRTKEYVNGTSILDIEASSSSVRVV